MLPNIWFGYGIGIWWLVNFYIYWSGPVNSEDGLISFGILLAFCLSMFIPGLWDSD